MGWFFNKNNNYSDQNNHSDSSNTPQTQYKYQNSFYSKKTTCQNDPEDDRYMICKTVIKDNDGTREEEEKLPKENAINNNSQRNFSFGNTGSFLPFRRSEIDDEKAFDKFQPFLIQPSFFDFHNSVQDRNQRDENQPNQQIEEFSRSYVQSRSCHSDPQDNEYLICKSKLFDGNRTKEVQQRVKASDQFRIPSFRGEFANVGNQIDRQIHNFMREMNSGFNILMPFVGSMMNFVSDLQNLDKKEGFQKNQPHRNYFPQASEQKRKRPDENDSHYFSFTKPKKDTNIYDL